MKSKLFKEILGMVLRITNEKDEVVAMYESDYVPLAGEKLTVQAEDESVIIAGTVESVVHLHMHDEGEVYKQATLRIR